MNKHIFHIPLILLCFVFTTCKKNPLPPEEKEEPVFYVKCDVNGTSIKVEAGEKDYYMYSSHYLNADSVYVYQGELKQKSCNGGCGYNVAILINDVKVTQDMNAPMKPDSALYVGKYGFNDGTPDPVAYLCSFTPIEPQGPFTWLFSDGVSSNNQQGQRVLRAGKQYTVGLKINNSMCSILHENEFTIGSPLTTIISGTNDAAASPTTFTFISSNSYPGVTMEWDFGDGTTGVGQSVVHTYSVENYYIVRLKLSKPGEQTLYSYYQVSAWSGQFCTANFNSFFIPVQNIKALSAITFVLTDPNGTVYTSQLLNQSSNSKVEIVSVEDFEKNSENNPTKKVKLRFSCDVKNGSDVIHIANGEAVIAVSYK